jgi:magnesium-transporting ATPase (P-type)
LQEVENLSTSPQVSPSINVILETPNTDLEKGIPSGRHDEQDQCSRPKALAEAPTRGFFKLILKTCNDWVILLLFVYAVLLLGFGIIMKPPNGWYEGVITILLIIMFVVIHSFRELWLERSRKMSRKQKPLEMQQREVDVVRGGCPQKVSISDVLLNDIVCLKKGSLVPADGLFQSGELLQVDDGLESCSIDENNQSLFHGQKVTNGTGRMLVTSVGMDTELGNLLSRVTHDSLNKTQAQLDKLNTGAQIAGLLLSVLNLLVLFVHFMVQKEGFDLSLPKLKGKSIERKEIIDASMNSVLKVNVKFSTLTNSILTSLFGLTEGVPFVIALANSYWNKKMASMVITQEPLALLTMSSVKYLCIDITGWPAVDDVLYWSTTRREIEALINAGVNIILISEDDVSGLKDIARQCGLLPDHTPEADRNRLMLQGEDFRDYTDEDRMNEVEKIVLMGRSIPFDKLLLVQCLKKKGQVVAMVGVKTNVIPALKEANVAISIKSNSELVRESSDIINMNGNLSSLVHIVRYGRCIYDNIGKYMQLVLTMNVAGLLITSITIMFFDYCPITAIQFCWTNLVVTLFGGVALLTEPPKEILEKTKPLIPKAIWRNILIQILYQVVSVTCQFIGLTMRGISKDSSKTIMFNVFVLTQVCNLVNSRQGEKKNVFEHIHGNALFLLAVGVILVLQVAFIETAHVLVGDARLTWMQWIVCLLLGMVSWAIDWASKWTYVL